MMMVLEVIHISTLVSIAQKALALSLFWWFFDFIMYEFIMFYYFNTFSITFFLQSATANFNSLNSAKPHVIISLLVCITFSASNMQ